MIRNVMFLLLGLLIGWGGRAAFANADPEGFSSINCPERYVCVTIEEYTLHWDVCPISVPTEVSGTPTPTNGPTSTNTPPVGSTSTPGVEPTPTDTPPVDPTPTDTPKEKEKCNKGGGNGSEGCDPGNNPDKGHDDEDQTHPHKGGHKK